MPDTTPDRSAPDPRRLPFRSPTPFLELDLGRVQRNLLAMQKSCDTAGVQLRPHVKTHKSLDLARRQIAAGAVGIAASKPSEAQVFVEGGIKSVTVAYPIVRATTIDSLLEAGRGQGADLRFIVGDRVGLSALEDAGSRHRCRLQVFLKVDVGLGRVGVLPHSDEAFELGRAISTSKHVGMAGLLSHAGHAYGAFGLDAIGEIAAREARDLLALKARLEAARTAVPCISVGSTPTCLGAPIPHGIDEVRPGNYVFLDRAALHLGLCSVDDIGMAVVATVVARNQRYAIIDAGSKALSSDRGPHGTDITGFGLVTAEHPVQNGNWTVEKMSEEHAFIPCVAGDLPVGSRVRVLPNHSCATAACFDAYIAAHDGTSIRIDARGRFT
ncbi:alanine racemase [Labrys miyagiensis]